MNINLQVEAGYTSDGSIAIKMNEQAFDRLQKESLIIFEAYALSCKKDCVPKSEIVKTFAKDFPMIAQIGVITKAI